MSAEEIWKKSVDGLYWAAERLHVGTAKGIAATLGFTGHWLGKLPWRCHLGLWSAILAGILINVGALGLRWLEQDAGLKDVHLQLLQEFGYLDAFARFCDAATCVGLGLVLAAFLAFWRNPYVLVFLRTIHAYAAIIVLYLVYWIFTLPGVLHGQLTDEVFSKYQRNEFWLTGIGLWPLLGIISGAMLLCLMLVRVQAYYGGMPVSRLIGDRVIEDIKTHGRDPDFRRALYWALFAHIFVFFILPLISYGCMEDPYEIPKGEGIQQIEVIKVKPKKKKKKKFVFNMNTAISFYVPELDDSKVIEELEKETQDQYEATQITGKLGKGKGKRGGWPHGMENARVRFIRLEYLGGDWDQDMGKGADHNVLIELQKATGFKIARDTESIPIRQLRRFPKNAAPPFVFITGKKGRIGVSKNDVKTLRWYCLEEGGMIFADNGGGNFNSNFRSLMRRVFPELDWVDIANDDIIFRQPYLFPNGAPPMWNHSGKRAAGLRYNGRWICFYHQGDLNDAWKNGHSGASEAVASQGYKMGINVINYAFNQYMSIHYGD